MKGSLAPADSTSSSGPDRVHFALAKITEVYFYILKSKTNVSISNTTNISPSRKSRMKQSMLTEIEGTWGFFKDEYLIS